MSSNRTSLFCLIDREIFTLFVDSLLVNEITLFFLKVHDLILNTVVICQAIQYHDANTLTVLNIHNMGMTDSSFFS